MPEGVAAMIGACLLFVLPVSWHERRFTLTWDEAAKIDWGITLLYGGGLALGEMTFSTGLAQALGEGVTSWLPSQSSFALTLLFTGAAIVVSEAASNTASANMIVPIAIAVSQAAGVRPIEPVLGATLGASMGFMMPVSTAPNAIVYSSGYVPIGQMMRHGVFLDVAAFRHHRLDGDAARTDPFLITSTVREAARIFRSAGERPSVCGVSRRGRHWHRSAPKRPEVRRRAPFSALLTAA